MNTYKITSKEEYLTHLALDFFYNLNDVKLMEKILKMCKKSFKERYDISKVISRKELLKIGKKELMRQIDMLYYVKIENSLSRNVKILKFKVFGISSQVRLKTDLLIENKILMKIEGEEIEFLSFQKNLKEQIKNE